MKKRMYRPLAALLSIAMLVGSVAVPVSAETSASETGFPEELTYQQVCANVRRGIYGSAVCGENGKRDSSV